MQIALGTKQDESKSTDPTQWPAGLVSWNARAANNLPCAWAGSDSEPVAARDASRQALVDLCQILLNTNEFFYLH